MIRMNAGLIQMEYVEPWINPFGIGLARSIKPPKSMTARLKNLNGKEGLSMINRFYDIIAAICMLDNVDWESDFPDDDYCKEVMRNATEKSTRDSGAASTRLRQVYARIMGKKEWL